MKQLSLNGLGFMTGNFIGSCMPQVHFAVDSSYVAGSGTTGMNTEHAVKRWAPQKDAMAILLRPTIVGRFGLTGALKPRTETGEWMATGDGFCIARATNLAALAAHADHVQVPVKLFREATLNTGFAGHWGASQIDQSQWGFYYLGKERNMSRAYIKVAINKWKDLLRWLDDSDMRSDWNSREQAMENLADTLLSFTNQMYWCAGLWGVDQVNARAMQTDGILGYTGTLSCFSFRAHPNRFFGKNKNGGKCGKWQGTLGDGYSMDTSDVPDADLVAKFKLYMQQLNMQMTKPIVKEGTDMRYASMVVLCPTTAYNQFYANIFPTNSVQQQFTMFQTMGKEQADSLNYGNTPIESFYLLNALFIHMPSMPDRLYKLNNDDAGGVNSLLNNLANVAPNTDPLHVVTVVESTYSSNYNNAISYAEIANDYPSGGVYTVTDLQPTAGSVTGITTANAATNYELTMTNQAAQGLFGLLHADGSPADCLSFQEVFVMGMNALVQGDDGGGKKIVEGNLTDYGEISRFAQDIRGGVFRGDMQFPAGVIPSSVVKIPTCYPSGYTTAVTAGSSPWFCQTSFTCIVYVGKVAR